MKLSSWVLVLTFVMVLTKNGATEEFNPVVGKVGDFVLREADVERLIGQQPAEIRQGLGDPAQRAAFVRQFLLAKGVAARAKKAGFDRQPEIKEQLSHLVDNYLAQEYVRKVVLAEVALSPEKIKEYYAAHQAELVVPPEAKARHIFFAVPDGTTPEGSKEIREKAEHILAQLRKGEEFDRLAREVSEDAETAANGGSLGVITPGRTNSREFEEALFSLDQGAISDLVETPFGYHIIKIDERKEQRTATLDESREYISTLLKGEAEQKKAQEFLELVTKEEGLEVRLEKPADQPTFPGKAGVSSGVSDKLQR